MQAALSCGDRNMLALTYRKRLIREMGEQGALGYT